MNIENWANDIMESYSDKNTKKVISEMITMLESLLDKDERNKDELDKLVKYLWCLEMNFQ